MRIPNLRHLQAITEIARAGSLSRAARSLHLSQSALTQALRRMEERAGQPLFERSGSGMSPTPAGQRFVARIDRAFEWLREIDRDLAGGNRPSPRRLRVTAARLAAFASVVDSGGYSLAARRLGLSQPSVHRAARSMEPGGPESLFRRVKTGVEPSPKARRLARWAGLAFAEIRHAFEDVAEVNGEARVEVRIGCLPLARSEILPRAVNSLLAEYPDAAVSIIDGPYDELLQDLRCGALDVVVGALREPKPVPDVEQQLLFRDPLAIVVRAGHPWLRSRRLDARRLAGLHWVVPRQGTPARDYFTAFFAERGIEPPRHVIECSSLVATRGLVLGSDRAALLSERQVRLELETGRLALLVDTLPGTERAIGLTVRRDWAPTTVMRSFIAHLRKAHQKEAPP